MKKFSYYSYVQLIAALACAAFLGSGISSAAAREQPGTSPGRLIIRRSPNLGTGLFLDVSIDGVRAGMAGYGQTFDAPLSPGKHLVSVVLRPNQLFLPPTQTTLMVQSGQTYMLTAMWRGQTVVLR